MWAQLKESLAGLGISSSLPSRRSGILLGMLMFHRTRKEEVARCCSYKAFFKALRSSSEWLCACWENQSQEWLCACWGNQSRNSCVPIRGVRFIVAMCTLEGVSCQRKSLIHYRILEDNSALHHSYIFCLALFKSVPCPLPSDVRLGVCCNKNCYAATLGSRPTAFPLCLLNQNS